MVAVVLAVAVWMGGPVSTQEVAAPARNPLPNPNPVVVKDWWKVPGRIWVSTAGVDVGPDANSTTCAKTP